MFDLRYHVASLAAVFVALVIGIFVGVGLSGRGFVNDAERKNFEARIDELRADRDSAVARAASAQRRGDALDDFADTTYTSLVRRRLAGTAVGVVFVGSVDQGLAGTIRRTVADAGGRIVRLRALRVPLDPEAVDQALRADPDTRDLAGPDRRSRLGGELARELVAGGQTPVLDRLSSVLVEEQLGLSKAPLDAVVVARPSRPQQGETEDFLSGLYSGLAASQVPSVGVENSGTRPSAVPPFRASGLATVDAVDTAVGEVALVFLLEGARPGSYGLGLDAVDGVLPAAPQPVPGE
jgi:Copper transport outer membrane protein, MctB